MSEHENGADRRGADTATAADARPEVAAWRLLTTLAVAGAIAGLAIVLVYEWAQPRIRAHRAAELRVAIQDVLNGPDRWETLYIVDGALLDSLPAGADSARVDKLYRGYDDAGRPVGLAITGAEPGFQDIIELIFGYDPDTGRVIGMKVLDSKETPGLGDKIIKDSAFVGEFDDVASPLTGVKRGDGTGDPHEVDMITGATISSRAVIDIINHRLAELEGVLAGPPADRADGIPGGAPIAGGPAAKAEASAGADPRRSAARRGGGR